MEKLLFNNSGQWDLGEDEEEVVVHPHSIVPHKIESGKELSDNIAAGKVRDI